MQLTGGVFLALGFAGFIAGTIGSYAAYDGDSCGDTSSSSYDEWDLCIDFGPELGVLASAMFAVPFVASGSLMVGLGGRRKRRA